jgi:peptidyl-tRNA hydrolase, PTH1 family
MGQRMFLLVGLGNPGERYQYHRHNVGFRTVEAIARQYGFGPWRKKFQGEISDGVIAGEKIILLKPQTYMNESGRSVGEARRFHKVALADVIVFYDELDLMAGKVRVKIGGGAAGHNGIRSIDDHIGADFKRVRLGIDHPGDKEQVTNHVLGNFAKADALWLEPLMDSVAREVTWLIEGDDARFATAVAQTMHDILKSKD